MKWLTIMLLGLALVSAVFPFFYSLPPDLGLGLNVLALFCLAGAYVSFRNDGDKEKKEGNDEKVLSDFKQRIERWKGVMELSEEEISSEISEHEVSGRFGGLSMPVVFKGESEYDKFVSEQEEYERAESWYERFCEWCWARLEFLNLKCPEVFRDGFEDSIRLGAIKTSPDKIWASVVLTPLLFLVPLIPIILFLPIFYKVLSLGVVLVAGLVAFSFPGWIASQTRMRVQTDMLYAMLYMSLYLRLNPNLEGAVVFTSERVGGPFGTDLKKAVWDLHVRKFPNIMAAVGQFQDKWAVWNDSFIKSLSVLSASLKEVSSELRDKELARALDLLMEGTHSKMEGFAEELSVQVKLFRGLLLLPILLSLVLPMVSVFMSINPGYLITLFNLVLPVVNFTIAMKILAERPGTFRIDVSSRSDSSLNSFSLFGFEVPVLPLAVLVFLVVSVPGWMHLSRLYPLLVGGSVPPEFVEGEYTVFSIGLSWLVTFGLGLAVFVHFFGGGFQLLPLRREVKDIEVHFQSTIRELGIALRENMPVETALRMILDEYERFGLEDSAMFKFLDGVVSNMGRGLSFSAALFDPSLGVMNDFPSDLVRNVMLVLTESVSKGPEQAALVCETISQYLGRVESLNKDFHKLVAEEVTSMQMESTLLAPLLAAGVAAMTVVLVRSITMIGSTLATLEQTLMSAFNIYQSGSVAESLLRLVDPTMIIPPTLLQVIIGTFLVEVTMIYCLLRDGIEHGLDPITNRVAIGKGTLTAVIVYSLILFSVIIFLGSMINMAAFSL